MKKFLLYWALLISVLLSPQCFAYKESLNEIPTELIKASMITATHESEEIEVVLWQKFTIYSLIVVIYGAWWLRQKA